MKAIAGLKPVSVSPWGVYSVWWRHFQVYRSTWLVNCLPPISEPIVYLLAFGYGLTPLIGEVQHLGQPVPYPQFLAPGMIAIGVLFQSFFEGARPTRPLSPIPGTGEDRHWRAVSILF